MRYLDRLGYDDPLWRMRLSNRQIKEADRVGGIDLVLPWPEYLPRPVMAPGARRQASEAEHRAAEDMLRAACDAADLVPVSSAVESLSVGRLDAPLTHLVVCVIGRRWVHATGRPAPRLMWTDAARLEHSAPHRPG